VHKNLITISCEGHPAPGASWSIDVEFRPLSRGYSVWLREDYLLAENTRWHKIGGGSRALDWKGACNHLASNKELRVFGSFWGAVVITGVPEWAKTLISWLFIEDEDAPYDFHVIAELLLGFSEEEIEGYLDVIGMLPKVDGQEADQTASALERMAVSCRELGLLGQSSVTIKTKLGLHEDTPLQEVAVRTEQERVKQQSDTLLAAPFPEHVPSAQYTLSHTLSPAILTRQITNQDYWDELSRGPLPADLSQVQRLLERWLREPIKPKGGNPFNGITDSGSEWPVLKWLLGPMEQIRSSLKRLMVNQPHMALELVGEVMRRGKSVSRHFEQPGQFSGWGANVIGRSLKRSYVMVALNVQAVADELRIAFPEEYRIGNLPHI